MFGSGASAYHDAESTVIATIPLNVPADPTWFELSCWFLLSDKDYGSPYITYKLIDSEGRTIDSQDMLTNQSTDNNGMWFRANKYIPMAPHCRTIELTLRNAQPHSYIAMDELVLRPVNATLVSKSADGKVMINNHIIH